jgi:hypothetical protein
MITMHNTDPCSGSTLTGAGMAGDQPCATTGTVHGRGSDELMTSRCVQGGCGSAGPRRLLFLLWVGHGVRGLGQWGWGHSPSFVVEIGAACGSDPVGSVSSLIEWGLESCGTCACTCGGLVGVGSHKGHTGGTKKGARGAVEGCGLCAACTDYCASTPIFDLVLCKLVQALSILPCLLSHSCVAGVGTPYTRRLTSWAARAVKHTRSCFPPARRRSRNGIALT